MVWKRPLTDEELYYQVAVFDRYDYNGEESTPKDQKVYFDPKRVGCYGGINAFRRVMRVPRKVVEIGVSSGSPISSTCRI